MFKLVCMLALVMGISATPTLPLKALLVGKSFLLGKLIGGKLLAPALAPAPVAYQSEPMYYYAQQDAPSHAPAPVAYQSEPMYYYAHQAAPAHGPAPVVVEARHAEPAPAPAHPQHEQQVVYYSAPAPEPVTYQAAPAPEPVTYQAAPQPAAYVAGPPQVLYQKPRGFELTKRFLY